MKTFDHSIVMTTSLVLSLAAGACATAAPPPDLLSARASYQHAKQSTATKLDPADMYTASKALDDAEHSFKENGDTQRTRDLAYTAERRAEIAEARSRTTAATQDQQNTVNDMHADQTSQLRATSTQLGKANAQIALQGQAMQSKEAQLATEKSAREASDKRATQAAQDLAKYASVKQEARGMVITLSGGVLFASGKSELLPEAQVKLNTVADALTQQDPDSKMVIEGHTDSQGKASYNQDLSERRAESVRTYLISRGIAGDRVTSQGFGSSRSVTDNGSAEGRANNRRVEIVVAAKSAHTL